MGKTMLPDLNLGISDMQKIWMIIFYLREWTQLLLW